jgi:RNA polymerase sigma-70 factor, ECF subfamily
MAQKQSSIERRERDDALIRRVQEGDREAFSALSGQYYQKLYGLAYGMLGNAEDARECVQDSLLKTYNNMGRFRFEASFYTWIYRITVNLAIDHRRKYAKRKERSFESLMQRGGEDEGNNGHVGYEDKSAVSPLETITAKQGVAKLKLAIYQLPEEQRRVIELRGKGHSYQEIGKIEEIPEGTVMSRLFYGRNRLKKLLSEDTPIDLQTIDLIIPPLEEPQEMVALLDNYQDRLTPAKLEAIVLRSKGYKNCAIAEQIGITSLAVALRIFSAREKLEEEVLEYLKTREEELIELSNQGEDLSYNKITKQRPGLVNAAFLSKKDWDAYLESLGIK